MSATKTQAEQCDPSALDSLIAEWQTVHDTVETALDKAGNDYRQSVDYWTGKTGDRARDITGQAVTAGRSFTGDLTAALATLRGDRDAIWAAKNRATGAITAATQAKYDVAEDGTVSAGQDAIVAATASLDQAEDRKNAVAALTKYGKDTFEQPIKTALNDLATVVDAAADHIRKAFEHSGGVTAVAAEAPGKLDPTKQLTAEEGKADGETIADGKLSDDEKRRILDHLRQTGLTPEQLTALREGKDVTVPASTMSYLSNLYDQAGRDGLISLSETLKRDGSPQSLELRQSLANGMMTLSNEHLVSRDSKGTVTDRGGYQKLNSEVREIIGTRPSISGAPDANTRDIPDDYRSGFFSGHNVDRESAIKEYTGDLDKLADFLGNANKDYQPGEKFGVELGRQAAHQAWIIDHDGYTGYEGTKLQDGEALRHTEHSAQNLLGLAARNHDADHALLTGNGSDELFGKDTPGQSWHPYDSDKLTTTLLTHKWGDGGDSLGNMYRWVEDESHSSDPAVRARASEIAGGLSRCMVKNYDTLMNAHGSHSEAFGQVNPKAVQALSSALAPYVPDMAGNLPPGVAHSGFTPPDGIHDDRRSGAQKIFALMDTDKDAATQFNAKALVAASELQSRWVESALDNPGNPEGSLATTSGRIQALVDQGLTMEASDRTSDSNKAAALDAAHHFANKGAAYDSIKSVLTTGIKYVPVVGDIAAPVIDVSNAWGKNALIGLYSAPDPAQPRMDSHFQPAQLSYAVADALQTRDGYIGHDPRYTGMFDSRGQLKDYRTLVEDDHMPEQVIDSNLTNIINGYNSGAFSEKFLQLQNEVNKGRNSIK